MEDHPRIRGKDIFRYLIIVEIEGSPPHTRERLHHQRIRTLLTKDHPRIRGKDRNGGHE